MTFTLQLEDYANDVQVIRGDIGGDEEDEDVQPRFVMVNSKTCTLIPGCFFLAVDREIEEVDWAMALMKAEVETHNAAETGGWDENEEEAEQPGEQAKPAAERIEILDDAILTRFALLDKIILRSLQTQIYDAAAEALLHTVTKWFRTVTSFVKLKTLEGGKPGERFVDLIIATAACIKQAYDFVPLWQNSEAEAAKANQEDRKNKKRKKGKAAGAEGEGAGSKQPKAAKESRLVPMLVYVIEVLERQLLLLAKATKVDLTGHFKRISARDFRISLDVVEEAMAEDDEGMGSSYDEDSGAPKKKKKKGAKGDKKGKGKAFEEDVEDPEADGEDLFDQDGGEDADETVNDMDE